MRVMRVGIVGCGDVASRIYVPNSVRFPEFDVVACADIEAERATALAEASGIEALSIGQLLGREDVDTVLNLTSPAAHQQVSLAAIDAGKHLYSEKPLAVDPAGAAEILAAARRRRVRVACSPDTFLGAGLATARRLVSAGELGLPISAEIVMQHSGPERFPHPRPHAFYAPGGGPLFDMGPYYLTPLVRMFGRVLSVEAMGRVTYPTRPVLTGPETGSQVEVTTPSHLAAVLQFEAGVLATMTMSFDCAFWTHTFTVNGSDASIRLPDPDEFAGPVVMRRSDDTDWSEVELNPGVSENGRGMGLADLALALAENRPHLASGVIALHVVDIMSAVLSAADGKRAVQVRSLDTDFGILAGELPGADAPGRAGRGGAT
jgi:predicted dehydrogenase